MTTPALFAFSAGRACAFPLEQVVETMRPLPVIGLSGMPSSVRGVSMIRGSPVPVVELAVLLTGHSSPIASERFVLLRAGSRRVALAVESVSGVRDIDAAEIESLPPLLSVLNRTAIDSIGVRDSELLTILDAAWIIPDAVWATIDAAAADT